MLHVSFTVGDAAKASYLDALLAFVRHYGYRESGWRPSYGDWNVRSAYEGWRTRFWIDELDASRFEAWFTYKTDIFSAFAPGADLLEIVRDFQRKISAVEGVGIEEGY